MWLCLSSNQSQDPPRSTVSYALPPGAAQRRVVERYSLEPEDPNQRAPSRGASAETRPTVLESTQDPAKTPFANPPANPVALSTPPQEEVCVECAMRDQDMIDVDVTSPGIWERESDAMFEELKRSELEDEANGVVNEDRLGHGYVNPREPAARQQTLNTYIKSQRTLLEAEALARARAMQEAKQLDNRMRDTYSQLRRSAYDTGTSPSPADDSGGVRINRPSPHQNGMIVEHVDVRKEEKEARERKRKEEKRAAIRITSGLLASLIFRHPQFGICITKTHRFFGMKNLSAGWRSQDSLAPSGISGSMMDMHVALQNEAYGARVSSPIDNGTARRKADATYIDQTVQEKPKKKKKGFAKIWGLVTGSSKNQNASREPSQSYEKTEDDGPLAPPPPLSYLVNRGRASEGGRHSSTPSLPSSTSPKLGLSSPGMSPPTAPSSILPSPASSRGPDVDIVEQRKSNGTTYDEEQYPSDDTIGKGQTRNVHPVTSEPDMRRASQSPPPPLPPPRPESVMSFRDKSLPPLPSEAFPRPPGSIQDRGTRRQSFGGLASRPALGLQTVPVTQPVAFDERRPFGARYDEYGLSRRSLGRLDNVMEHRRAEFPLPAATKRRSRFGLSALLGKKSKPDVRDEAQHFPTMQVRRSGSEGGADDAVNGYATSTSRHSAFSMGGGGGPQRMSVTSRKALEDLVAQDPDFVAYRYPSNDQHLDILR
ncbi:hypothetical protein K438DRAFT_1903842 [Mycena galopus ATCC 62051]|nr:hypothetical protein K438DRAFT_1903842 [Mycena galopus ATCC 62051]